MAATGGGDKRNVRAPSSNHQQQSTVAEDASKHTSRARSRKTEATRPWSGGSFSSVGDEWEARTHTPCMLLYHRRGPVSPYRLQSSLQSLYTLAYTRQVDNPTKIALKAAGQAVQESPNRNRRYAARLVLGCSQNTPYHVRVVVVMEARTARTLLVELKVLRSPARLFSL